MSTAASFVDAWSVAHGESEVRQAVRLVPAGPQVDDPGAAVACIRGHLESYGVTPATLARALDVKPGVVTLLLDNAERIPAGPRHTLLRDAERWCRADAHERELRRARFVPTAVTRLTLGIARAVRDTRTIGLLFGGAGLGKSHALNVVRAELPGETIIVRADPDSRSAKGLLRAIGGAGAAGPAATLMPSVKAGIQAVRQSNGLLILDEAHLLAPFALEAARAIFDQADVGLLLVGTAGLRRTLNPVTDPLVGPLVSRIALRVDLDAELLGPRPGGRGVEPWIDAATLRAILARHVTVTLDADAIGKLLEAANTSGGHLRTALNAARVAGFLARRAKPAREVVGGEDVAAALRMAPLGGEF